ncbi:hypothetical protein [Microvirga antarctica]|uniref:hypothetical protein n=1 Tax=Microvirga antarctica TaxID=2819233 RepID=UPI001B30E1B3|nr:hypothetical protein [Microvirga antarctica]
MTVVPSRFPIRQNELYETEPWATKALLRHFPVAGMRIWEPAAGNHMMADVLRDHGATVFTSDIAVYTREHDRIADFIRGLDAGPPCDGIVTNPPYGKGNREAVRFIERALAACDGLVAMLLTAKFDFGKTRLHLTRDNPRFLGRIALVDRIQWFPGATTGTEDHAWFVWGAGRPAGARPILLYEGKPA